MALENWLDDKKLRTPHPDYPGSFAYDPALVDFAEVESWAQIMLENDFPDMGYHEKYGHKESLR